MSGRQGFLLDQLQATSYDFRADVETTQKASEALGSAVVPGITVQRIKRHGIHCAANAAAIAAD